MQMIRQLHKYNKLKVNVHVAIISYMLATFLLSEERMTFPNSRELSYGSVEIHYDEVLGIGAYGKVCKAKCGQLPNYSMTLSSRTMTQELATSPASFSRSASFSAPSNTPTLSSIWGLPVILSHEGQFS